MAYTLKQLADHLGTDCGADAEVEIVAVAPVENASSGSITFVNDEKYLHFLDESKASAVIVSRDMKLDVSIPVLRVENPRAAYARLVSLIYPEYKPQPGLHPSAVIASTAQIGSGVYVGANCVIEDDVSIADNVRIDPGVVIGRGSQIGSNTHLCANSTVYHGCRIGDNCIIHSAAVIGSDGFGFEYDQGEWLKIPQVGGVVIGNNVEIGACSVVDRGALNDTVVEDGVKLDNHVQIAHNVRVGEHTIMSRGVGIAGSSKVGKNCIFGGMTGVKDHVEIADNVIVTAMSMVSKSLTRPGSYSSNTPIDDTRNWRKNSARFRQLDDMARKIRQLEKQLEDKA